MEKKVLYLDIDGVLNNQEDFEHLISKDFNDPENYFLFDTGHFVCDTHRPIGRCFFP
jgi:hypothetical protein